MARKILIAPLGTGPNFGKRQAREYPKATYRIDGIDYPDSKFIASVLYQHLELDGIYFIGTARSMWEEAYRFFCEQTGIALDEDYWVYLAETAANSNHKSSSNWIDLSKLEAVLGKHSKCIPVEYGIDEKQIWNNLDRIIESISDLQQKDEIYIDITHAFRSLSLFQFLTINFINDLLSEREIEVRGVYYGMLELNRDDELGYAPIVDLSPLLEMMHWIKGSYSLKNFGNGYLISDLLKQQNEKKLANRIWQLSDAININYVTAIGNRSIDIQKIIDQNDAQGAFKHIKPQLEEFSSKFATNAPDARRSNFQLKLANWYFQNRRYATGYITLAEAIVTHVCEHLNRDINNFNAREEVKDQLTQNREENQDIFKTPLAELYRTIAHIRNAISHASFGTTNRTPSFHNAIENAQTYSDRVAKIFEGKKLGN
jgi:CRISPR-associated Csx2 family protein